MLRMHRLEIRPERRLHCDRRGSLMMTDFESLAKPFAVFSERGAFRFVREGLDSQRQETGPRVGNPRYRFPL